VLVVREINKQEGDDDRGMELSPGRSLGMRKSGGMVMAVCRIVGGCAVA